MSFAHLISWFMGVFGGYCSQLVPNFWLVYCFCGSSCSGFGLMHEGLWGTCFLPSEQASRATQQDANEFSLAMRVGLFKDESQVCADSIHADTEFLRSFT